MNGCDCGGNVHNEEHADDCAGWRLEVGTLAARLEWQAACTKALMENQERLTHERNLLRNALEGICDEFERTVAHADWRAAGSKGMSVPFRSDFASAAQLPSVVARMRWWVRLFRKAMEAKE